MDSRASSPRPSERTVMAAAVQLFVNFGLARGLDPDALCRRAGFAQRDLERPESHVPFPWFLAICDEVIRALPDRDVGVELGLFSSPDQGIRQGYLAQALRHAPTPLAALALGGRALRYVGSLMGSEPVRLSLDARTVTVELVGLELIARECIESMVISTVAMARMLAAGPVRVEEVHLARTPVRLAPRIAAIVGAPVHVAGGRDALIFERASLEQPTHTPDEGAACRFEAELARRVGGGADGLAIAVRSAIEAELTRGSLSQERVARHFGLSARSLQRRLRECGVRYNELVDQARKAHAERLLADRTRHIGEVASAVGYDLSSFNRVFRRWSGMSPSAYRKARWGERAEGDQRVARAAFD